MKLKDLVGKGLAIARTSEKDKVVKRVKRLLEETSLSISDLDMIISSIDGRLWEEEIKKLIAEQTDNKLWTMEELEELYTSEIDLLQSKLDQVEIDKEYLAQANIELNSINGELNSKNQALNAAVREKNVIQGLLERGEETDLYANEVKEILLDTLEKGLAGCKEGTRRHDILKSILKANHYSGEVQKKQENIKSLLKGMTGPTERIEAKLENIGLKFESSNSHVKYSLGGDKRYLVTLPKTASDGRAGKNIASTIISTMF